LERQIMAGYLSVVDRIYGLSLLWRESHHNFAFFDRLPDLNWKETYLDFLPQVMAAADTYAYYRLLAQFMAQLKDGHTGVLFPKDVLDQNVDFPAVALDEMEHSAVVVAVDRALLERIPLASVVTAVAGSPVEDLLRQDVLPYVFASSERARRELGIRGIRMFGAGLLAGPPGSTAALTLQTPQGEPRTVAVTRSLSTRPVEWLGRPNIDPAPEVLEFSWLEDRIACLALHSFMDDKIIARFEAIKPDLLQARGIILDLRRNMGGSTGIGAAILDHFSEQELLGSRSRTRKSIAAQRAWSQLGGEQTPQLSDADWVEIEPQRRAVISGPKIMAPAAVLIGRGTVSAAEDFLVMADSIPHFTTIGEPTCGTTGQPLYFDLPGGGMGFIVTKHDTYPDGREFVGPGIQPEIWVEHRLEAIQEGIDADLEQAIKYLRSGRLPA
jgi:carboxyl-terminal processing protease